jgi:hypothetical protein
MPLGGNKWSPVAGTLCRLPSFALRAAAGRLVTGYLLPVSGNIKQKAMRHAFFDSLALFERCIRDKRTPWFKLDEQKKYKGE